VPRLDGFSQNGSHTYDLFVINFLQLVIQFCSLSWPDVSCQSKHGILHLLRWKEVPQSWRIIRSTYAKDGVDYACSTG